jgi:hypothetical protein
MLRAVAGGAAPYAGSYTYATLPTASTVSGYQARVSNLGISPGMLLVSDGTRWIPDGVQVLARSAATATAPLDTSENILATIAIPAGLLGISGRVEIMMGFSVTNNANAKTIRARLGGIGGTILATASPASVGGAGFLWTIANRGAANSQYGGPGNYGIGAGGPATAAIDTTAAQDLVITIQKATGADAVTLDQYEVKVTP